MPIAEHDELKPLASPPEEAATVLATSPRLSKLPADLRAITKTLKLFLEPGQVTELRAFRATTDNDIRPQTISGFFDDPKRLVNAVGTIRSAEGIYTTLNPVDPSLLKRSPNRIGSAANGQLTQDTDIVRRRRLLVDIGPQRQAGVSSTQAELSAAMKLRNEINRFVKQHGWPEGITAASGNGIHLLYRIDLPADDGGLVRRCLEALGRRFNNDRVLVDRTVCEPARIVRLYGTRACEGAPSAERPHRISQILFPPEKLEVVPVSALEELAAEVGKPDPKAKNTDDRASAERSTIIDGRRSVCSLPMVVVPGGGVRVTDTARELGNLLGATGRHFRREQSLTVMRRDEKGTPILELVKPAKFISLVEDVCQPVIPTGKGDVCAPTVLGKTSAEAILHADALLDNLPPIKVITRCPILLERNRHLVEVAEYDRESGIYASGRPAKQASLQQAKELLPALLYDFRFASESDRSRALAALITPALVFGGLLPGRAPAT
jgi:hypothetical protein